MILSDFQWLLLWWAYGLSCAALGWWWRGEARIRAYHDGTDDLHVRWDT